VSFQTSDSTAKGINLISNFGNEGLWVLARNLGITAKDLKEELEQKVTRRNQIAHEADIEYPFGTLRTIDPADIIASIDFIEQLVETIHILVV
jgi:hypothetical protein